MISAPFKALMARSASAMEAKTTYPNPDDRPGGHVINVEVTWPNGANSSRRSDSVKCGGSQSTKTVTTMLAGSLRIMIGIGNRGLHNLAQDFLTIQHHYGLSGLAEG